MQETEVKILEIDRKKIEGNLADLGAKKIFDGEIQTVFFDFKDGSIVKAKNVLRLRQEQGKIELTFKKVYSNQMAKQAEELTVEVSNLESLKTILENIGLKATESMQKHRVSYRLDGVRFDIDKYSGAYACIPEFMEIEAGNTDLVTKYALKLGFKPEECLPWSTNDLIQHYSKKRKT